MPTPKLLALNSLIPLCLAFAVACSQPDTDLVGPREVDSATAALVNNEPIYFSDVELEAAAQGRIEPGDPFDSEHPDYQPVLDQLIDQRLLAQEAVRLGLDRDPLANRRLEAGRERILGNILVENLVASQVTEAAIDLMYSEQVKLQQLDDEVRLRHILVETEGEAQALKQELNAGGDFTDLAFRNSIDIRTRIDGGNFGWVSPNELIEPFPSIVGDTAVGEESDPFESEQGWHILRVDERRTRPPKTKEEMRPEIITFLTFTQISDILRELRASATISSGTGPALSAEASNSDPALPDEDISE